VGGRRTWRPDDEDERGPREIKRRPRALAERATKDLLRDPRDDGRRPTERTLDVGDSLTERAGQGRERREGDEGRPGLGPCAERIEGEEGRVAEVGEGLGDEVEEVEGVEGVADDFGDGPGEDHERVGGRGPSLFGGVARHGTRMDGRRGSVCQGRWIGARVVPSGARKGGKTDRRELLCDGPDGPESGGDLGGRRADGRANPAEGGMDDLEDGRRLDDLDERADRGVTCGPQPGLDAGEQARRRRPDGRLVDDRAGEDAGEEELQLNEHLPDLGGQAGCRGGDARRRRLEGRGCLAIKDVPEEEDEDRRPGQAREGVVDDEVGRQAGRGGWRGEVGQQDRSAPPGAMEGTDGEEEQADPSCRPCAGRPSP